VTRIDVRPATEAALRREPPSAAGTVDDRRRPGRSALVVVVVLTLLAAGGWWWAPVAVDLGEDVATQFGSEAPSAELAAYGERGAHVLGYVDGTHTTVTVVLSNLGPLPVTVHGARLSEEPFTLVAVVGASAGERALPVTIGRGESLALDLTVRFDHCDYYHERALEVLPSMLVDVSVLGRSGTTEVTLDRPILVRSPMIVDCPDRLLDRQARTRTGG
jgi:hypothetical protein